MLRRQVRTGLLNYHRTTSSSSKLLDFDELLGKRLRATAKELSVEMLPALKVLSESLGLLRQTPALKNWSASDWLVGLSVLAHYKTKQRADRGPLRHTNENSIVNDKELLVKLLRYVRVCDAVYASSVTSFCKEAGVSQDQVLRAHPGGVLSPKCIIFADHKHRELVLVVRGTASLLDFCTDLCLQNEPFQDGQAHRGMMHAATWLVRHLRDDLQMLSEKYAEYNVVTTGHSLGAAVAALSAMQLKEHIAGIHCYAFGTPACVTQELATGSYDLITTIINGYDCVPRLHQHSLVHLQREVQRFNWRDELRKQKLAVERQQRAKLDELQAKLRNIDPLQLKQRTSVATAKLDEAKKLASNNIKEFANEIDRLLSEKLDISLSFFKTDKLSLEHISFIKNLLRFEDLKKVSNPGDFFWWKRIDGSILALERLSAAVTKPDELERVLVELRDVLYRSSQSTKSLLNNGEHSEWTQLQLFRSRIDNIIDKTRESLKSQITEQVSKVSTAVVSNVKDCVEAIKEETQAFSTTLQEELDVIANTISQNLPFTAKLKGEQTIQANSSEKLISDEKNRLGENSKDANVIEQTRRTVREEAGQKLDRLTEVQKQYEDDNMLRHDPLFPPGRILYLNHVAQGCLPKSGDNIDELYKAREVVEIVEVPADNFSQVMLSDRMLLDHLCTDYERILQLQAELQGSDS
ncbi:putative fungal lipase-like domain, alpha/Beta hydrolase [Plasmopara halstedii]